MNLSESFHNQRPNSKVIKKSGNRFQHITQVDKNHIIYSSLTQLKTINF